MLVTNPLVNDSRVLREADALAGAGYEVRAVATQAPGLPVSEIRGGLRIMRVPSEPRLAAALRRLAGGFRRSARVQTEGVGLPGVDGARSADAALSSQTWIAVAGGRSDWTLLRRDPRAAVLRVGLRVLMALRWWRYARSAWAAVRTEPADVFLAHDLDTLPLAVLAARRLGGAVAYDSHELYTDQTLTPPQSPLWRPRWRLIERALIRRADLVITVCDGIADELASRYGIERPAVVRNIPELPGAASNGDGMRGRLGIDAGSRIALYLGGIQLNRQLEHLIDAVQPLRDVVLVLMGPGDPAYVEHLRSYAGAAGNPDKLRIAEPVEPELVVSTARDADVGLVVLRKTTLSEWYCLPSKLFESIQAGIPVVASDWPELRRVVEGYGVGVLCGSDEPGEIGAAIRRLLEDRESYERMRENARRASGELNWGAESKRLLEAIDSVAPADRRDARLARR